MKTIREWFNELPDGYKELALKNCRTTMLDTVQKDMISALARGFVWVKSDEGYEFWQEVYEHYFLQSPLPPLP
jgi:hypothetical protein